MFPLNARWGVRLCPALESFLASGSMECLIILRQSTRSSGIAPLDALITSHLACDLSCISRLKRSMALSRVSHHLLSILPSLVCLQSRMLLVSPVLLRNDELQSCLGPDLTTGRLQSEASVNSVCYSYLSVYNVLSHSSAYLLA